MSILLATAAAAGGQREWRRVTVGSGGSGRFGYSTGLVYGSINYAPFRGQNIIIATAQNNNFEIVVSGIVAMTFFDCVEVLLSNGQSRFFYTDPTKGLSAFNQNTGVPSTQWDWNSLPANYTWTVADVGLVRGIHLS